MIVIPKSAVFTWKSDGPMDFAAGFQFRRENPAPAPSPVGSRNPLFSGDGKHIPRLEVGAEIHLPAKDIGQGECQGAVATGPNNRLVKRAPDLSLQNSHGAVRSPETTPLIAGPLDIPSPAAALRTLGCGLNLQCIPFGIPLDDFIPDSDMSDVKRFPDIPRQEVGLRGRRYRRLKSVDEPTPRRTYGPHGVGSR